MYIVLVNVHTCIHVSVSVGSNFIWEGGANNIQQSALHV